MPPFQIVKDEHNPLDSVEDVLHAHNWHFNRMTDDELMVSVTGKSVQYRLFFIWQEDMSALQFCVQYDMMIGPHNLASARAAIADINEGLWMGHFDLPKDTGTPTYRYTSLLRTLSHDTVLETVEDMVDISMAQCERYFPVFALLSGTPNVNDQNLSLALMDTAGES